MVDLRLNSGVFLLIYFIENACFRAFPIRTSVWYSLVFTGRVLMHPLSGLLRGAALPGVCLCRKTSHLKKKHDIL